MRAVLAQSGDGQECRLQQEPPRACWSDPGRDVRERIEDVDVLPRLSFVEDGSDERKVAPCVSDRLFEQLSDVPPLPLESVVGALGVEASGGLRAHVLDSLDGLDAVAFRRREEPARKLHRAK